MSESLLLHALSLNDRILEPNSLPVAGRVWAYGKEDVSREMFVGNCITMLSLLGVDNAKINWKDDIMAFDVSYRQKPATVIISLRDDSLASDYFYFFGVWMCPDSSQPIKASRQGFLDDWRDDGQEDLLKPALTYSTMVWDMPLQVPDMRKMVQSELMGQRIYHDAFYLCGQMTADPVPNARFVICPTTQALHHGRYEIRHALYSLRNMMALMGRGFEMHERLQKSDAVMELYHQLMVLMSKVDQTGIKPAEWDYLVCEQARIALRGAAETVNISSLEGEARGLIRLFEAIKEELCATDMRGMGGLFQRLQMPFQHVHDVLESQLLMLSRTEKQVQILQPFMHSRMLAGQQKLLELMLMQKCGSDG